MAGVCVCMCVCVCVHGHMCVHAYVCVCVRACVKYIAINTDFLKLCLNSEYVSTLTTMYSCNSGQGWVGRGCLYSTGMNVFWSF